jgi:hypothetical protein
MKDERDTGRQQGMPDRDLQREAQRGGKGPSSNDANESTPIYLTTDSTLQTPDEHEHDQQVDPRKDDSMDVSDTDLEEIKAGRLTGREPGADRKEDQ